MDCDLIELTFFLFVFIFRVNRWEDNGLFLIHVHPIFLVLVLRLGDDPVPETRLGHAHAECNETIRPDVPPPLMDGLFVKEIALS